jgi:hypothetical protein
VGCEALAQLAQQHHRARGTLARAQLQVLPPGHPRQTGGATRDHPHLPTLPPAGQDICLPRSGDRKKALDGVPGCAVSTLSACGMARAITPPASI